MSRRARRKRARRDAAEANAAGAVVDLTIKGGANHQVKHMLKLVGRPLALLHRAAFAGVTLGDLPLGAHRELTADEVAGLRARAE